MRFGIQMMRKNYYNNYEDNDEMSGLEDDNAKNYEFSDDGDDYYSEDYSEDYPEDDEYYSDYYSGDSEWEEYDNEAENYFTDTDFDYDDYESDDGGEDTESWYRKRRDAEARNLVCGTLEERKLMNRLKSIKGLVLVQQKKLDIHQSKCRATTEPTKTTTTPKTETTTTPKTETTTTPKTEKNKGKPIFN